MKKYWVIEIGGMAEEVALSEQKAYRRADKLKSETTHLVTVTICEEVPEESVIILEDDGYPD